MSSIYLSPRQTSTHPSWGHPGNTFLILPALIVSVVLPVAFSPLACSGSPPSRGWLTVLFCWCASLSSRPWATWEERLTFQLCILTITKPKICLVLSRSLFSEWMNVLVDDCQGTSSLSQAISTEGYGMQCLSQKGNLITFLSSWRIAWQFGDRDLIIASSKTWSS